MSNMWYKTPGEAKMKHITKTVIITLSFVMNFIFFVLILGTVFYDSVSVNTKSVLGNFELFLDILTMFIVLSGMLIIADEYCLHYQKKKEKRKLVIIDFMGEY